LANAKSNDSRRAAMDTRVTLETHLGRAQNDYIWGSLIKNMKVGYDYSVMRSRYAWTWQQPSPLHLDLAAIQIQGILGLGNNQVHASMGPACM